MRTSTREACEGDIVSRLRRWCHAVDAESAQDLMDEAATEIERLRNGALPGCETVQDEPVAFAVVCKEMTGIDVYDDAYDAAEYASVLNRKGWTANVVRLVPKASPTLTDAEREAVEWFATFGNSHLAPMSNKWSDYAATLRSLLERLA